MSVTILSTIAGVLSVFISRNNSVNAAFPDFCSSRVSICFSACNVSFAIWQSSLINSIEFISPFSALSLSSSSRSLNFLKAGLPLCLFNLPVNSFKTFCASFWSFLFIKSSITSASRIISSISRFIPVT